MEFFKVNSVMFKATNVIWNDQKFNDIKMVGSMTGLLKQFRPKSFKEFMLMYFESGKKRKELLKNMKSVPYSLMSNYGRTQEEIFQLIIMFQHACYSSGIECLKDMDTKEAMSQVYKRLFEQTFAGRLQEIKAHQELSKFLEMNAPQFICKDATPAEDAEFAIDLIIRDKKTDIALMGIQVKPSTYKFYDDKKIEQRRINEEKNLAFLKKNETEIKKLLIEKSVPRKIFYLYYSKNTHNYQFENMENIHQEVLLWK